jgi:hypothetical protein
MIKGGTIPGWSGLFRPQDVEPDTQVAKKISAFVTLVFVKEEPLKKTNRDDII